MDEATLKEALAWARDTQHMTETLFSSRNKEDMILSGHVIQSMTVSGRTQCILKCMGTTGCKSFNFGYRPQGKGQHDCQLNSIDSDEALDSDLQKMEGFALYDMGVFFPFIKD